MSLSDSRERSPGKETVVCLIGRANVEAFARRRRRIPAHARRGVSRRPQLGMGTGHCWLPRLQITRTSHGGWDGWHGLVAAGLGPLGGSLDGQGLPYSRCNVHVCGRRGCRRPTHQGHLRYGIALYSLYRVQYCSGADGVLTVGSWQSRAPGHVGKRHRRGPRCEVAGDKIRAFLHGGLGSAGLGPRRDSPRRPAVPPWR